MIYSVRIFCKENELVDAVCIQEFFKFCGICSVIHTDESKDSSFRWGKTLVIGEDWKIENGILLKLFEIFEKNKFAELNFQLGLFIKQMSMSELLSAADKYLDCFFELRQLEKETDKTEKSSVYLTYALLNCARKVNLICKERGNLLRFDVDKMRQEACGCLGRDPEFFMGEGIAALLCFQIPELWEEGGELIQSAIEKAEKNKFYSLFLQYVYAHFMEEEKGDLEKAERLYQSLKKEAPLYYRASYKCGYFLWKNQKYEEAWNVFLLMTDNLKEKWKSGWILPQELEYLYKGCMFLDYIDRAKQEGESQTPAYAKEVILRKSQLFQESRFVQEFWEGDLEKKDEYFQDKLRTCAV